jgi:hypothetical protein
MKTKEVNGVKFKVDEKWEQVRDRKPTDSPIKKKGFFRNLLAFLKN